MISLVLKAKFFALHIKNLTFFVPDRRYKC